MNASTAPVSPWHFALFRIVFGLYLLIHFLQLFPWAGEVFSRDGFLSDPSLNPAHGLFPNPLAHWDSPLAVQAFLMLGIVAAIFFTAGLKRPWMAAVLWFVWTALFHRNNLTANPSIPYIGLLLGLCALVPTGEPWCWRRASRPPDSHWHMPIWVYHAAWWLLAAGYSFSGWTKLQSPSWLDGTALRFVLENPLARPGLARDLLLALPDLTLMIGTWGALFAELLFLPLAVFRKMRPWIWLALLLMHLTLILVIDFADLSLGMLIVHLFVFDPRWLRPKRPQRGKLIAAFDGTCLLCQRWVRMVAAEDHADLIRFTTLQEHSHLSTSPTMLVWCDGRTYRHSSAVIVLLETLGGHWRALAMLMKLVPRVIRNPLYRLVARFRTALQRADATCGLPDPAVQRRLTDELPSLSETSLARHVTAPWGIGMRSVLVIAAGATVLYQPAQGAWFPFTLMERAPQRGEMAAFQEISQFAANDSTSYHSQMASLRPGDVIAFHMPRKERWDYLLRGKIQKLPYELFRFGHLALVVDDPHQPGSLRLLQLAMKQPAHIDEDLRYLADKHWIAYRPTQTVHRKRLQIFVTHVLAKAHDRRKAYDYSGAFGFYNNASIEPNTLQELHYEYTCSTLILAALHYAGHSVDGMHRDGFLDIVTPAQVIRSRVRAPN